MATETNLDDLSLEELKALSQAIGKAIRKAEADNLKKAREALEAVARQFGVSLEDLVTARPGSAKKASQAKYRNPDDPTQTWSGRGRQPRWFRDAVAAGRAPGDLTA